MVSLGCPKNLVDSEVMLGLAQQAGHQLTRDAADADVLVVNTCAFIDKAKQESIDTILEMAEHKKTGRCKTLVVTGCLAERYRDELRAQIPEIDAVLGTGEVPAIVDAIGGLRLRGYVPVAARERRTNCRPRTARSAAPPHLPTYIYDADTPRLLATPRHYAYVKIAEGCDYKCAFCIIPTLRGHYRSRPAESIVARPSVLPRGGVKELLLISQDTSFYGVDRGERGALARLLRDLNRDRRPRVDPHALPLSDHDRRRRAGCDGGEREGLQVHRPAAAACVRRRVEADEAAGHARGLRAAARLASAPAFPASRFARRSSSGSRARPTRTSPNCRASSTRRSSITSACSPTPTRRARRRTASTDDVPAARQAAPPVPPDGGAEKTARPCAGRRASGSQVRLLVDGPSDEHELVLRARLEGQAPDIDPLVYLTDCDPASIAAGTFIDAEIVGARGLRSRGSAVVRNCIRVIRLKVVT